MDRILFIGNSHTYYNEMPKIVEGIGRAAGLSLETFMVVKGGWYLRGYDDETTPEGAQARRMLDAHPYRYVVLQDQSTNPALDPEGFQKTVKSLCDKVRAIGAQPVLYQTWAFRDGSELLRSTEMTYEEMHERVRDSYRLAAKRNDALLAPIGDLFRKVKEEQIPMELMAWDDRHATLAGSYLAASGLMHVMYPELTENSYLPLSSDQRDRIWNLAISMVR